MRVICLKLSQGEDRQQQLHVPREKFMIRGRKGVEYRRTIFRSIGVQTLVSADKLIEQSFGEKHLKFINIIREIWRKQ